MKFLKSILNWFDRNICYRFCLTKHWKELAKENTILPYEDFYEKP